MMKYIATPHKTDWIGECGIKYAVGEALLHSLSLM